MNKLFLAIQVKLGVHHHLIVLQPHTVQLLHHAVQHLLAVFGI